MCKRKTLEVRDLAHEIKEVETAMKYEGTNENSKIRRLLAHT